MKHMASWKKLSYILVFALALGLFPAGPFETRTAKAAPGNVTIDLGNVQAGHDAGYYFYDSSTYLITVSNTHAGPNNTVTITGDGTNGIDGYSIKIDAALKIVIAAGTKINGSSGAPALRVPAGATITGDGAGITITSNANDGISSSGDVTLAGALGSITSTGVGGHSGIYSNNGDVNISGTVVSISGNIGIYANGGNVNISGTVGSISGGPGILAIGNVNISGTVGSIRGGNGIYALGNVNISGTVDSITGIGTTPITAGINASVNVNISGTVGSITSSAPYGILSNGNVTITGKVDTISGSAGGIDATHYVVLDYNNNPMTTSNWLPTGGRMVTFDYGGSAPTGAPQYAHISNGNTIPAIPSITGIIISGWYKDAAFVDPWIFSTLVDGTILTLYAKWVVAPTGSPSSDYSPTFTTSTLTDKATGVAVTGGLDPYARLRVTQGWLHPKGACNACDEIRTLDTLAIYDISITGYHSGPYRVFIPFAGGGGVYTMLHCNNGALERQTAPYANGGVTAEFGRLSPFAVVRSTTMTVPENIVVDPPKTGQAASVWGYVLVAAAMLCAVRRRKRAL